MADREIRRRMRDRPLLAPQDWSDVIVGLILRYGCAWGWHGQRYARYARRDLQPITEICCCRCLEVLYEDDAHLCFRCLGSGIDPVFSSFEAEPCIDCNGRGRERTEDD